MKLLRILKEMVEDRPLAIEGKPIRIVKYTPTGKYQIALINPKNNLVTATFGTQFPSEGKAESFLCSNISKIENYFLEDDMLEEGIEERFEIIDREIKCDI